MRTLLLVLLLALSAIPATAQITPLASLTCTAATYPDCGGWRPIATNAYYSRRFVNGGGPQGQAAVEFTHTPVSQHAQYYHGWYGPALPQPAAGVTRVLRLRIKPIGPIILAGVADVWTDKFVIIGDGDNPTGRVICVLGDNGMSSDNLTINCQRNSDGAQNGTARMPLTVDAWNDIQMEFKSSSNASTANGRMKLWRNSNVYASPTVQSNLIQLNAINWGQVSVGYYANATLRAGSRVVYQLSDIVWDDEFDPNWSGGTTPPPQPPPAPTAPTNIQVIIAGCALPLAGWLRRRRLGH